MKLADHRLSSILTVVLFLISVSSSVTYGQILNKIEPGWQLGLDYFFDNVEFDNSDYTWSGTMNGIWISPAGQLGWSDYHSVNGGVKLLTIPGAKKAIEKVKITAFYEYETPKVLFRAGSFPRRDVLGHYNTFFFKDSVQNFVPLVQGVYWRIGNDHRFVDAWMDWTGYSSSDVHEQFMVGFSGRWTQGVFFADFQSYLYHHALTDPAIEGEGVSENLQLQATSGIVYNNGIANGLLTAGVLAGYERDRRFDSENYKPVGLVVRAEVEYRRLGMQNLFYAGSRRMKLNATYGDDLYWGTPFLQGRNYLRSDWYVNLLERNGLKVKLNSNLHLVEGKLYFQQQLKVHVQLGN